MKRSTIDLALKLTAKTLRAVSPQGESVILKLPEQHEVEVLQQPTHEANSHHSTLGRCRRKANSAISTNAFIGPQPLG